VWGNGGDCQCATDTHDRSAAAGFSGFVRSKTFVGATCFKTNEGVQAAAEEAVAIAERECSGSDVASGRILHTCADVLMLRNCRFTPPKRAGKLQEWVKRNADAGRVLTTVEKPLVKTGLVQPGYHGWTYHPSYECVITVYYVGDAVP